VGRKREKIGELHEKTPRNVDHGMGSHRIVGHDTWGVLKGTSNQPSQLRIGNFKVINPGKEFAKLC